MITNPISYAGNKSKLVKQLIPEIYSDGTKFVDVFCGGGTVAFNSTYTDIVCNDISKPAIDLLKYMYETPTQTIVDNAERIIDEYGFTYSKNQPKGWFVEEKHEGLSRLNKKPFNNLKNDFNNNPSMDKLFILLIYGFNHYMRFNSKGEYNVPVGKVDMSASIYKNMIEWSDGIKEKTATFYNKDFREKSLYEDLNAVYYFDPPYLITTAPYNGAWDEKNEYDLLNLLDELNEKNVRFALSNVILSNGKENLILKKWSEKYNVLNMKRQYRNANYQKKNITDSIEVLVKNY